MVRPAHPRAMTPHRPGRTRTAPPQMPASWWSAPRIRNYLLFDATGIAYFVTSLLAIRVVWALGSDEAHYTAEISALAQPAWVLWHVFALLCVVGVAVRFFRLFPKAQPARIGRLKPPPRPVLHAGLYAIWIAVTLALGAVLAGAVVT